MIQIPEQLDETDIQEYLRNIAAFAKDSIAAAAKNNQALAGIKFQQALTLAGNLLPHMVATKETHNASYLRLESFIREKRPEKAIAAYQERLMGR